MRLHKDHEASMGSGHLAFFRVIFGVEHKRSTGHFPIIATNASNRLYLLAIFPHRDTGTYRDIGGTCPADRDRDTGHHPIGVSRLSRSSVFGVLLRRIYRMRDAGGTA